MTANSLDEKPAIQASSSTTKMMRLLAPAFPLVMPPPVFEEPAAAAVAAAVICALDLFVTPVCCAIFFAVVFNTQKHDTHTVPCVDSSATVCVLPPPPTGQVLRGRRAFVSEKRVANCIIITMAPRVRVAKFTECAMFCFCYQSSIIQK